MKLSRAQKAVVVGALVFLLVGGGGAALMLTNKSVFDAAKRLYFLAAIPSTARQYADQILQVAKEQNVDPMLIVALGERESRWGDALTPKGPGGTGDGGHGRGLMQIDDRSHADWLAANDWTDPLVNIRGGVKIFMAAYNFMKAKGLQGEQLMQAAAAAYNAGAGRVWQAVATSKSPDSVTTGGDYGSDVVKKMASYASSFNSQAA